MMSMHNYRVQYLAYLAYFFFRSMRSMLNSWLVKYAFIADKCRLGLHDT